MRLAILSDIHANLHALEAVWQDLEQQHPEAVYCLGDLVGYGAYPNEVVAFIRERQVPTIMGNYDEGVGFDLRDCGCVYRDPELARLGDLSLLWSREHTSGENKLYLQGLPLQIRLPDGRPTLLLVHGSPRKMNEYLYEDRPRATFERIAAVAAADVLLFGHTHLPYQKKVDKVLFVNTGSVGKPKDGDRRAGYVILEMGRRPRVEFRRVEYDVAAAAGAVRNSGLPPRFADMLETGGQELS
ncbi:MAG TPA: metallophosphoesterase family protein [Anaerolineales bacterium]